MFLFSNSSSPKSRLCPARLLSTARVAPSGFYKQDCKFPSALFFLWHSSLYFLDGLCSVYNILSPAMCNPGRGSDEGSTATFVQADSACFRDLVQRLTSPTPPNSPAHRPTQKLHERRKCNNPKIEINDRAQIQRQPFQVLTSPPMLHVGSPKGGYWAGSSSCPASPSDMMLLSPLSSLHASVVSTPVTAGRPKKRASPSAMELLNPEEEERAIKEKRFYLHPSPQSKPRLEAGPELLPLFPLKAPAASTSYET